MVMDRKRSFYFGSLVVLLVTYQGIYGEEDIINYKSDTNRSEYVFQGEGVTLYCNIPTKNPDKVKKLYWEFNGKRILTKRKYTTIEKGTIFSDKIDTPSKDPFSIHIKSVSIAMSGKYKCFVTQADDKQETTEFFLPVIIDACKDSDWKFTLSKESCEETIEMKCEGVYPKPLPKCLFVSSQVKQSITLHTEQLPNETYKISIHAIYKKKDFENVTDLTLSCMFVLDGTNYEFGIKRDMFGERGCSMDYPGAGKGHVDAIIEKSCWDQAANGSIVTYRCDGDEKTKNLTCINDTWMDESGYVIVSDRNFCSDGENLKNISSFTILIAILMLYYY